MALVPACEAIARAREALKDSGVKNLVVAGMMTHVCVDATVRHAADLGYKITLLGEAPKARATDPDAYALFLQARQLVRQSTAEAFKESDALYRRVLAIDPRYAPAWSGLAGNFTDESSFGVLSSEESYARAREALDKALAIDPDYAPAHANLGWARTTWPLRRSTSSGPWRWIRSIAVCSATPPGCS